MTKDLKFFRENSPSKSYLAVILNPCFHSVILYRLSNFLYRNKLSILAKLVWLTNRVVYSVDIDYRATIGESFMLVHGIGTVIGSEVNIGNRVKIYHGVTLGGCGKTREYNGRIISQPQVGDDCIIYTNACAFGPIIIDNDTKIKACAVVSCDVSSKKSNI